MTTVTSQILVGIRSFLRQKFIDLPDQIKLRIEVPGIDAKDLDVKVT